MHGPPIRTVDVEAPSFNPTSAPSLRVRVRMLPHHVSGLAGQAPTFLLTCSHLKILLVGGRSWGGADPPLPRPHHVPPSPRCPREDSVPTPTPLLCRVTGPGSSGRGAASQLPSPRGGAYRKREGLGSARPPGLRLMDGAGPHPREAGRKGRGRKAGRSLGEAGAVERSAAWAEPGRGRGGAGRGSTGGPTSSGAGCQAEVRQLLSAPGPAAAVAASRAPAPQPGPCPARALTACSARCPPSAARRVWGASPGLRPGAAECRPPRRCAQPPAPGRSGRAGPGAEGPQRGMPGPARRPPPPRARARAAHAESGGAA